MPVIERLLHLATAHKTQPAAIFLPLGPIKDLLTIETLIIDMHLLVAQTHQEKRPRSDYSGDFVIVE